MTSTTTTTAAAPPSSSSSAAAATVSDKDLFDVLAGIAPAAAQAIAPEFGIDPRLAGQTVSQVLSIFGIGGGKGFTPATSKTDAFAAMKEVLAPHVADPQFKTALNAWLKAAVEPARASKQGKDYVPTVDLSKDWFSDAISSVGNALSNVNWGQVAQVGMQVLPYALALI
jgi:hypothetical protein